MREIPGGACPDPPGPHADASPVPVATGTCPADGVPDGSGMNAWKAVPDDTGTRFDSSWLAPPVNGGKKLNSGGAPVIPEIVTDHVQPVGSGPLLSVASSLIVGRIPWNSTDTGC